MPDLRTLKVTWTSTMTFDKDVRIPDPDWCADIDTQLGNTIARMFGVGGEQHAGGKLVIVRTTPPRPRKTRRGEGEVK